MAHRALQGSAGSVQIYTEDLHRKATPLRRNAKQQSSKAV